MKTISNQLTIYGSWSELQHDINTTIGWQDMTLYDNYDGQYIRGKKIIDIKDPIRDETIYLSYKNALGVIVGIANIYIDGEVLWVGNFEIKKNATGMGYGRDFWKAIEETYKGYEYGLTYHDNSARKFWEKCGFKVSHARVMVKK